MGSRSKPIGVPKYLAALVCSVVVGLLTAVPYVNSADGPNTTLYVLSGLVLVVVGGGMSARVHSAQIRLLLVCTAVFGAVVFVIGFWK